MSSRSKRAGGRHPIGVVAHRTGLSRAVLRAWERRYGAVRPDRTESGRRRYTDADVARLRRLKAAVDMGRTIGEVAGLDDAALEEVVAEDRRQEGGREGGSGARGAGRRDVPRVMAGLAGVKALDQEGLERELCRAALDLESEGLVDHVLAPMSAEIAELWARGRLSPAGARVASGAVQCVLRWILDARRPGAGRPEVVVGPAPEEAIDFTAIAAGVAAALEGWRVVSLGPGASAAAAAETARRRRSQVLALSVVGGGRAVRGGGAAKGARDLVAPRVGIWLVGEGGAERGHLAPGVEVHAGLPAFRRRCRAFLREGAGERPGAGAKGMAAHRPGRST